MPFPTTLLTKLVLPAAALSMSALGLAQSSDAHQAQDQVRDLPLDCEIAVSRGRTGHTYEARIHADRTIRGHYELNIKKRGQAGRAMISQSGDFHVAAGRSASLGQATFGGLPPESVDAELTLTWNGETLICTNDPEL